MILGVVVEFIGRAVGRPQKVAQNNRRLPGLAYLAYWWFALIGFFRNERSANKPSEPSRTPAMTFDHPGRFTLQDVGRRPGGLVLRREAQDSEPAIEYLFAHATQHDLPQALNGISVREFGFTDREWLVSSAGRDYHVRARSLQIHEGVSIYGGVLPLARYSSGRRALWTVLLWLVRFGWGRALIRWARAR